uniref:Uncharacterized protein n=1 Tax=Rhodnius prolixus TaxID=13249 RepID=T1HTW1_RHOPR
MASRNKLAFLVVCFIFAKVAAWFSNNNNNKRFYKDNELYSSYPENEYESFEFKNNDDNDNDGNIDDHLRKRNERESDFYDIGEENTYDTSNDLYPSLNLFSWWSSKNKGLHRDDGNKKNKSLDNLNDFDNKLKHDIITNILENDDSNEPVITTDKIDEGSFLLTQSPVTANFQLTNNPTINLNLQVNIIEHTTSKARLHFLYKPTTPISSTKDLKQPLSNNFDKFFDVNKLFTKFKDDFNNVTTEAISCYNNVNNASINNISKQQDAGKYSTTEQMLIENVENITRNASLIEDNIKSSNNEDVSRMLTNSRPYLFYSALVTNKEADNARKASIRPMFRISTTSKENKPINSYIKNYTIFQPGTQIIAQKNTPINDPLQNNVLQLTGYTSSSANIVTQQMYNRKQSLTTYYNQYGSVPTPSSLIKQALIDISRQLNLHKGTTLLYPQSMDGSVFREATNKPMTWNFTRQTLLITPNVTMSPSNHTEAIIEHNIKAIQEDDPFSFLKPIPTLKSDLLLKPTKMYQGNVTNSEQTNEETNVNKLATNTDVNNNEKVYHVVSNFTEPKFVLPEYLSGLLDINTTSNSGNYRKKRENPQLTATLTNDLIYLLNNNYQRKQEDFKRLFSRESQNSTFNNEDFLNKFKNLQNDLVDLQKALVTQAKDVAQSTSVDDNSASINDTDMTVHVRVIVDVLNGTDGNQLASVATNHSTDDEINTNHTLSKRSWLFVPENQLENEPKHLLEKLIEQKALYELAENSLLKKTNDENSLEENNDIKVNLNFPPSLLQVVDINTNTTNNPIITNNYTSYNIQNNDSKLTDSQFLLTKTQLVNPVAKDNIVSPLNKALYSEYLTGRKYLVIPLSYLEEQNKRTNNDRYTLLQPTSVILTTFDNNKGNSSHTPINYIANYLNKIRLNKGTKSPNKSEKKKYVSNTRHTSIATTNKKGIDKNASAMILFGTPELISTLNYNKDKTNKAQNVATLNQLDSSSKLIGHPTTSLDYLNFDELLKDPSNVEYLNHDMGKDRSRSIFYVQQLLNPGSYQLKSYNNNNNDELFKAKSVKQNSATTKQFLFFTLPSNPINDFQTESPPCTSYCKLNNLPFLSSDAVDHHRQSNHKAKKPNKVTPNLKTFKVDLNVDDDPFDKFDWNLEQNKNSLNEHQQQDQTSSSENQGTLLFASKDNSKKRSANCLGKFKRIPREGNLRRSKRYLRKFKQINGEINRHTAPKVVKECSRKSYDQKLLSDDARYESSFPNNEMSINSAEHRTRYYTLKRDLVRGSTVQGKLNVKLNDFEHKIQKSLFPSITKISSISKSTMKVFTQQGNCVTTGTSTEKSKCTDEDDLCIAVESICAGPPPPTAAVKLTTEGASTTDTPSTATPSEEEIQNACTECQCAQAANTLGIQQHSSPMNTKKFNTSIRPRGAQCHHHLKNHTTLQNHKMHYDHKPKENVKKKYGLLKKFFVKNVTNLVNR